MPHPQSFWQCISGETQEFAFLTIPGWCWCGWWVSALWEERTHLYPAAAEALCFPVGRDSVPPSISESSKTSFLFKTESCSCKDASRACSSLSYAFRPPHCNQSYGQIEESDPVTLLLKIFCGFLQKSQQFSLALLPLASACLFCPVSHTFQSSQFPFRLNFSFQNPSCSNCQHHGPVGLSSWNVPKSLETSDHFPRDQEWVLL